MSTTQSQILTSSLPFQQPPNRSTKRKVDDAFYHLDKALLPSEKDDEPKQPATKKMRFPTSVFSTLSKYGIKSSKSKSNQSSHDSNIIKTKAPHLSAILSRSAAKKEKEAMKEDLARASQASSSTMTLLPVTLEYRPSSTASFLGRLATFKLSTYSMKPSAIDAVAASKAGWVNEGKERLACGICKVTWVLASRDGMTRDAANALVEKQRGQLISMHKDGCPWKTKQCDDSIYCLPLKAPSALAKDIKHTAVELDSKKILEGVEVRHPLTGPQVQNLMSALTSVRLLNEAPVPTDRMDVDGDTSTITTGRRSSVTEEGSGTELEPSQLAALIATFGWSLAPVESRPPTPSLGRADTSSIAHGSSISAALPRQASLSSVSTINGGASATTARPSRIPVSRSSSALATSARLGRQEGQRKRDETLLHCSLCQRKVGLWTFKGSIEPLIVTTAAAQDSAPPPSNVATTDTPQPATNNDTTSSTQQQQPIASSSASNDRTRPQSRRSSMPMTKRQFDLLKEHRSYCPYVVRTTTIPSLSSLQQSDAYPRSSQSPPSSPSRPTRPGMHPRSSSASSFTFTLNRGAPAYPAPGTPGSLGEPTVTEGWRAVVTVVLRTGLGRRSRMRRSLRDSAFVNVESPVQESSGRDEASEGRNTQQQQQAARPPLHERSFVGPTEIDGIHAMVDDVKFRGGKDLLRYVRGLFQ